MMPATFCSMPSMVYHECHHTDIVTVFILYILHIAMDDFQAVVILCTLVMVWRDLLPFSRQSALPSSWCKLMTRWNLTSKYYGSNVASTSDCLGSDFILVLGKCSHLEQLLRRNPIISAEAVITRQMPEFGVDIETQNKYLFTHRMLALNGVHDFIFATQCIPVSRKCWLCAFHK